MEVFELKFTIDTRPQRKNDKLSTTIIRIDRVTGDVCAYQVQQSTCGHTSGENWFIDYDDSICTSNGCGSCYIVLESHPDEHELQEMLEANIPNLLMADSKETEEQSIVMLVNKLHTLGNKYTMQDLADYWINDHSDAINYAILFPSDDDLIDALTYNKENIIFDGVDEYVGKLKKETALLLNKSMALKDKQ